MISSFDIPALAVALLSACSWAALVASLHLGRTTPSSISSAWLLLFGAAATAALIVTAVPWITLRRSSILGSGSVSRRVLVACLPLVLSLPYLIAIYRSDVFFHYLSFNPIPRTLVTWMAPCVALVAVEALLVWSVRIPRTWEGRLRGAHSVPILIFAAFTFLYLSTSGGHLYSPDELEMYQVTESISRGTLATSYRDGQLIMEDGVRRWSKYGLVPSLLALPPYGISKLVGAQIDPPSAAFPIPNGAYPLVDLLVNPLVTAATCALLYCLSRRIGFGAAASLVVVVAYAVGTSAWVYSKTFFGQPVAGLFLLGATYSLVRRDRPDPLGYGIAGLLLGLAVGTRFEILVIGLPLGLLVLRDPGKDRRAWFSSVVAFGLAFAIVAMAAAGWYNWVKTGSIMLTSHNEQTRGTDFGFKPYIGLFGTFFSSGFGLFTFNPVTMLGVFSLSTLSIVRRREAVVVGLIMLASTALYSVFDVWYGGFTWANRYMVALLPFFVLPIGVLLERPWRTPVGVAFVATAILLGCGVNLLGVMFDFNLGWLDLWSHNAGINQIQFDPHFSVIGAHLRLLGYFLSDGSKLDLYLYFKFGWPVMVLLLGAFVLFATLAARVALRLGASEPLGSRPFVQCAAQVDGTLAVIE